MRKTAILSLAFLVLAACNKKSDPAPSDGRPIIKVSVDAAGYHPTEAKAKAG